MTKRVYSICLAYVHSMFKTCETNVHNYFEKRSDNMLILNQTKLRQARPSQTKPCQTKIEPSQAKQL
jgi:hypothetical protein